jgi:diguanylate cyclase (GGDEF)-like protein
MHGELTRRFGDIDTALRDGVFEHAPAALWLEDYSELHALFARWRAAGVTDFRAHVAEDFTRAMACAAALKIIAVNRRTLTMFEAADFDALTGNLDRIFRDDMLTGLTDELARLWDGEGAFSGQSVNYALGGKRMDVLVEGVVLPGYEADWRRVLVMTTDISAREDARRALAARTAYAHGLFDHSPVSLWVEDFSAIKTMIDDLKKRGIDDLRVFTDVHPEFVERCMAEIRVIDVNRRTLELFGATDKRHLLTSLAEIFRDDMRASFREQLIDLWNGKLFQQREVVNFSLAGDMLHLVLQFSVLPGHERDWALVHVALTDITARKKAEAYLEFLGKHDVLTGLHNRSYYTDELVRLQRRGPHPVSVLMMDLNGLKPVNDEFGHDAGDALLRRAGEVLKQAVNKQHCAARVGGDEFLVLMAGAEADTARELLEEMEQLIALNNQFYVGPALDVSYGIATGWPGERVEDTVKRADQMLLAAKRAYYDRAGIDRRR